MAMNRIRFQDDLSSHGFMRRFCTEEQYAQAIKLACSPQEFRCPRCATAAHCVADHGMRIQFDDANLGGERSGVKAGRCSGNKVPVVAAVSIGEQGRPRYMKVAPVAGFTLEAIAQWTKTHPAPGAQVTSEGLGCFAAMATAGCLHTRIVVGSRKPCDLPEFTRVDNVLGNLKTTLAGILHAFSYRKYAAFAYRFNRRFDLRGLVARFIFDVARGKRWTQRAIRMNAEVHC